MIREIAIIVTYCLWFIVFHTKNRIRIKELEEKNRYLEELAEFLCKKVKIIEERFDILSDDYKTMSRLHHLEQEREIDYAMLKETREDVKKLKSQLYIAEGE